MDDEKIGGIEKYEVENALRTLIEAEEIKADDKMMKAVAVAMKQKKDAEDKVAKQLSKVTGVMKDIGLAEND